MSSDEGTPSTKEQPPPAAPPEKAAPSTDVRTAKRKPGS